MLPKSFKSRFFDTLSGMTARYVKPQPFHKATGLVARAYEQIADDFFINAPMSTHDVKPQLLAGVWMAEREIVLADQYLTREDKEALGVTVSQVNQCAYCEDLLNSVVYGANEQELAETIRYHQQDTIKDARTRDLHAWALACNDPDANILSHPPFTYREAPEVIGTAFMLNYFNRFAQVFFSGTPLAAPFSSTIIKSVMYRLTGMELRESVVRRLEPGRSLDLLEPADLPSDLRWAAGNTTISAAMSRWASVILAAAHEHIPQPVREVVTSEINGWRGEPMGMSRAWLTPRIASLDVADAAIARLALLTALAPSQMSDDIIAAHKEQINCDTSLVVTVAWAAFMASQQVAGWLSDKTGYFNDEQLPIAS